MTMQESHLTLRVKIEPKPEGGYVAISPNPQLNFEGATREEVENKVRAQLVAALGPQVAGMLPANFSDPSFVRENVATPDKIQMNIKKSFSITVNKHDGTTSEFSHTFGGTPNSSAGDVISSSSASSEEDFGPVRRTGDGSAAMLMLRILIAGIVVLAILFLIRR